ncbi:MAG: 4'-phosphopantetheinyl transferase superfamily protein [Lachnospiraceae bacterium]
MIYLFDKMETVDNQMLMQIHKFLPIKRQDQIHRYRNMADKKLCMIAYLLLRYGVRQEYGIREELEFDYLDCGKPILRNYPRIHFNMSHCRLGAVCAISNQPIGVDIQDISTFDLEVAKLVCNKQELEQIQNASDQGLEFCKLWTAKESVIKKSGEGISCDLKALDLTSVKTKVYHDYVISVI